MFRPRVSYSGRFIASGPCVSNISHVASANCPRSPAGLWFISIRVRPFGQQRLRSGAVVLHANGEQQAALARQDAGYGRGGVAEQPACACPGRSYSPVLAQGAAKHPTFGGSVF